MPCPGPPRLPGSTSSNTLVSSASSAACPAAACPAVPGAASNTSTVPAPSERMCMGLGTGSAAPAAASAAAAAATAACTLAGDETWRQASLCQRAASSLRVAGQMKGRSAA